MSLVPVINLILFKNKYSNRNVANILEEDIGVECYKNEKGQSIIKRYDYPQLVQTMKKGELVDKIEYISHRGRAYVFKRDDFLSLNEIKNY